MKLKPAGVGLEPKKIAILGALLLVLVYFLWPSSHNESASANSPRVSRAVAPPPLEELPTPAPAITRRGNDRGSSRAGSSEMEEFRPSLRKVRQGLTDPSRIDPTLRLDLLARLQNVKPGADMRSLFEASDTPPVKITDPKPVHPTGPVKPMPTIAAVPTGPPPPPPPPPIPLKFYGFVNPGNMSDRRAFFLDGDDILVAREGETLQKRYKIIRIGVNSALVEDTQFNNQQSLPIIQEAQAAG